MRQCVLPEKSQQLTELVWTLGLRHWLSNARFLKDCLASNSVRREYMVPKKVEKMSEQSFVSDICEGVDIEGCIMVSMSQWVQMMTFFFKRVSRFESS